MMTVCNYKALKCLVDTLLNVMIPYLLFGDYFDQLSRFVCLCVSFPFPIYIIVSFADTYI